MKIFNLPDLGEGLPDAVIREWHVQEGDRIAADESLVTVETAKALVEVPSPWAGVVAKRFAETGATVETGQPLVGFESTAVAAEQAPKVAAERGNRADTGTVVGKIELGSESLEQEVCSLQKRPRKATPALRALARRLQVDLDALHSAGARLTEAEIRHAAGVPSMPSSQQTHREAEQEAPATVYADPARRAMALAMGRARDQVCPMTLCDEVDITSWKKSESTTLRLLRAIAAAALAEPNLNACYENDALTPRTPINVGLAVDACKGLFVPVLKDVVAKSDDELLQLIQRFKQQADEGAIPQPDLQGATIHLSNFGSLGGRFATPVVVPPLVCIVGAGRCHDAVLPHKDKARVRRLLPLSVTADHRAVTGGELARFLSALKAHLAEK